MSENKRFAVGDIHGNYKGFKQALERAGFNYDTDLLISLGDVADGYSEVPQVIEEFRKIKNLVWILGNHDEWVQNWMSDKTDMTYVSKDGNFSDPHINSEAHMWLSQGGRATYTAYINNPHLITEHRDFWLKKPVLYHILDNNETGQKNDNIPQGGKCFVHGGFHRELTIAENAAKYKHVLYWDRSLWSKALSVKGSGMILNTVDGFDKIFLGHTATTFWGTNHPMYSGGIWNLDTGGGWAGKITVMNIDTEEYYQSDLAETLYPNEGRQRN